MEKQKTLSLTTTSQSFDENHQSFSPYFKTSKINNKQFILDIDLDVFSSDGRTNYVNINKWNGPTNTIPTIDNFVNIAMPFSYEHTAYMKKYMLQVEHFEHPSLKELKNEEITVTTTELSLIKVRMDQFFQRLLETKNNQQVPAIITLIDSSKLQRVFVEKYENAFASSVEISDSNFTPVPLVFLINYYARKKIKEIYNIDP
jgi:hypothetical protein